ncbi:TRAP transporter small permease [Ramlibacter rhizophilus]|uniref:TRAP transporter small permease protein n=1 Tax=Ramlibacter rhizophilus TaxID=1781167 RepID=A0A4Z0BYD5_9BURK|nr:TRAP transporter small permease subunit [Ramlibacter rhizophilus]TFZ04263.1 TRAP transporter small permease subunit [Ramlibacter rhizophilus]
MRVLEMLAKLCAILAGVLLTFITLMTCASLIGRNTTGWTLVGDFELTGVATGAAIALFLPWAQATRANIIVDFFTTRARPETNAALDRLGALLLALAMGLMTWRTTLGGLNSWETQTTTMMLGWPEWTVYAAMVPALLLTALIALVQALRGFGPEVQA